MLDRILTRTENWVMVISFLAITLLAFVNVLSRYLLHASLSWSVEIIVGLAVFLIMVGTSAAIRGGAHPDFSVLKDGAKGPLRAVVIIVIGIAMAGFLLLLMWLGMDMVTKQLGSGRATPGLGIPQWILSLAIPIGALMGVIRSIQITLSQLRNTAVEVAAVNTGDDHA